MIFDYETRIFSKDQAINSLGIPVKIAAQIPCLLNCVENGPRNGGGLKNSDYFCFS